VIRTKARCRPAVKSANTALLLGVVPVVVVVVSITGAEARLRLAIMIVLILLISDLGEACQIAKLVCLILWPVMSYKPPAETMKFRRDPAHLESVCIIVRSQSTSENSETNNISILRIGIGSAYIHK
jgi:hypothetical protein